MRITAALAAAACLLPGAAAAAADQPFRSLSYEVSLTPDFAAGAVAGRQRLRLRSLADGLDTLSFTANPLAVEARMGGKSVKATVEGDRRIFHLPRRLAKGESATLEIDFSGRPGRDLVLTSDEMHTAFFTCEVMICDVDRPDDRARLRLELTLPAGMEAVAPGKLVSRKPAGSGRETWRWRLDRPYPSYLFGFAAGRYARTRLEGTEPLWVLSKGQSPERIRTMFADTARMAAFYEAKAGLPLPEGAYTQVLVDTNGDQEDVGLSMIETGSVEPVLADPQSDGMVAHELAHQWWGNLVTCSDWKELWLNEGMAGFMTAAYREQRWGRAAYDKEMAVARRAWDAARLAGLDHPLSWQGTYPTLRDKRRIAYGKSMLFLDALRTELGEAGFWGGLRRYTQVNAGRSVTAADLQAAFETASGRDLSAIFRTWVYGGDVSPAK